jgi:CheY-like chemotaxis protein
MKEDVIGTPMTKDKPDTEKKTIEVNQLEPRQEQAEGISHDFQHLMTSMLANIRFLEGLVLKEAYDRKEAADCLVSMRQEVERAVTISERLLGLIKRGPSERGPGERGPSERPAPVRMPQATPAQPAPSASGSVLLADDDEGIRHQTERLLKKLGFQVLLAKDGKEAVEQYEAHRHDVSLVILDMIMPRMNGKEALKKLKALNFEVKVLLTSGYVEEDRVQDLLDAGAIGFISKPYSASDLKEAIEQAIDLDTTGESAPGIPLGTLGTRRDNSDG